MTTVTPVADAEGNIIDFQVGEQSGGQATLDTGAGDVGFSFDAYTDALREAEPDVDNIVAWMDTAPEISDDTRRDWNQAIDNQDMDSMFRMLEQFRALYEADGGNQLQEQRQDDDYQDQATLEQNWFDDIEQNTIEDNLNYLLDSPPEMEDYDMYANAVQDFDVDTAERTILQCGAAIAAGQMTMREAFDVVLDTYGESGAAAAYARLQEYYK